MLKIKMIKIKNKIEVSYNKPPMVIAEISGNHNGNKTDFKISESACMNGADLIKIQTYEPQDITLNNKKKFKIETVFGKIIIFGIYTKSFSFRWHNEAFKIAKKYKNFI